MPKSKLRKKKVSAPRNSGTKSRGFFAVKHPFSDIPRDALKQGFREISERQREQFPRLIEKVGALARANNPLQVLAALATFGLSGFPDKGGKEKRGAGGKNFNQSHVELLQAFYLRLPEVDLTEALPGPDDIQAFFDILPELAESFHQQRLGHEPGPDAEDAKVAILQEWLRMHTQGVRNWGYFSHVVDTLKKLCAPVDEVFQAAAGIKGTEVVTLFAYLMRRSEQLVNARLAALRPVMGAKSMNDLGKALFAMPPELYDSTLNSLVVSFHARGAELDEFKTLAFSYLSCTLAPVYTLDIPLISQETGIPESSVTAAFDKLSLRFGDLENRQAEYLFLDNPVWTQPVIKLGERRYFCATPQVVLSFSFQVLSSLLVGHPAFQQRYEKRKANFLESEIALVFKNAFPECEIAAGYRWKEADREFENDLMVRVDSHLILVEAKSHAISWPALRGSAIRAKRHVEDILLAPSVQSFRLEQRVREAIARRDEVTTILPDFPVQIGPIRTVVRLSVTLEDFATLQTAIRAVKEAGWVPADHQVAPCLLLTDLKIVFDLLETASYKVHYLKRRAELDKHFNFHGDELDLLGLYLNTGFNLEGPETENKQFFIFGMSEAVDKYYTARDEGINLPKPAPRVSTWWRDMLKKIEDRSFQEWSDFANLLLSVPRAKQVEMRKEFKGIAANVRKYWGKESHLNSIIHMPLQGSDDAVALYAFNNQNSDDRYASMSNTAGQVFAMSNARRCLVIGVNIDRHQYPYSLMTVHLKDEAMSF